VHGTLTERWLVEAGLGEIAEEVARHDADFDRQYPGRRSLWNATRHLGPSAGWWARHYLELAKRERSARYLGWALHCAQDRAAHGLLGHYHIFHRLRLKKDDPDDWKAATDKLRDDVRRATDRLAAEYAAHVRADAGAGR
jgi:hypothetical protein